MLELAWNYLSQGDIVAALAEVMTNYPLQEFGLIWIILGVAVYAVMYAKTGDYGIPAVILTIYLALVSTMMAPGAWIAFIIILAYTFAVMFFRLIKD
jgi:cell division protein FtsW (lipid II flippase)